MKKKDAKSSTLKTKYRDLDQYKSFFFMDECRASDKFLDQLAQDLMDWARKEDSLKFFLFLDEIGVHNTIFDQWCAGHKGLARAKEWAMRLLGARREIGTIKGDFREKPIMHTLYQYDPTWKEADEYQAKKARDASTPEKVDVNMNVIMTEDGGDKKNE